MSEGLLREPEWVRLAALIRSIDGNHDLGAGELAARLIAAGVHLGDEGLREATREELLRELWRRAEPGHVHVIPLGYGAREAHEGDTYSLVGCWECGQMLAVAPGGKATRAAMTEGDSR